MGVRRLAQVFLLTFIAVSVCQHYACGQGIVTGSIVGSVQDSSGAVIPGATIKVVQHGTNSSFEATTTKTGDFEIRALPIGSYTVTIDAPGFSSRKVTDVTVNAGTQSPVGAQVLTIGSSETVTVEGATALLQTEPVQITQIFDTKSVTNLPIGNGFDIVALLTPGVAPSGGNVFTNNNGAEFSTNGLRDRNNNFQLDGQDNNDTNIGGPSLFFGNQDALAEVQIITNDSAEYGRNSGSIVNYITKAGTNDLHGAAYEFYNGSWADSLANQDKNPLLVPNVCLRGESASTGCTSPVIPRFVDNRWGGAVGGPILHDKLWFFGSANLEHTRTGGVNQSSAPFVTPTPNGLKQLQQAFPGNDAVAALSAIGPLQVKGGPLTFGTPVTQLINGVPIEFAPASRALSSPADDYEYMARVDSQLTVKDRIFGRYIYQRTDSSDVNFFGPVEAVTGGFVNVPGRTQYISADWTHTFNPHFFNQTRYSWARSSSSFEGGGFPSCTSSNPLTGCPQRYNFNDGQSTPIGENNGFWPQGRTVRSQQFQDNASYQAGRHFLKFGGQFAHYPETDVGIPYVNGQLAFGSFQDFINNNPAVTNYTEGNPVYDLTYNQGALYLQDDYKALPNFTLSLGIRWEIQSQPINGLHAATVKREQNPQTAIWNSALPIQFRTVPSLPLVYHNVSPIVGFAWTPGKQNTVIRGGFRISYDPTFNNPFANIAENAPVVNSVTLQTCVGCIAPDGLGVTARSAVTAQVPAGDPRLDSQVQTAKSLQNPYTEQWNLGVQTSFTSHVVGEVRYLGNHGVHLFQSTIGNPALGALIQNGFQNVIPAGLTPCSDPSAPGFSAGFVNCNFTDVVVLENTAFSNYNGLQTRLNIQGFHGITAGADYTFSKTFDNSTEIYSTNTGGNTSHYPQNPFDIGRAERGLSGLDYPHLGSIYMVYEIPLFRGRGDLAGRFLSGWQVNPVWRYASGQPYTVTENYHSDYTSFSVPFDTSLCDPTVVSGGSTCRPILANSRAPFATVGLCTDPTAADCGLVDYYRSPQFNPNSPTGAYIPVNRSQVHWIVNDLTAAKYFGTPFAGAGRNLQRGQAVNTANLALLKDLKVRERLTFQLRATAYNVLNHQFRGTPGVSIDGGSFDEVGGSFGNTFYNSNGNLQTNSVFSGLDRRRIELGGKIIF